MKRTFCLYAVFPFILMAAMTACHTERAADRGMAEMSERDLGTVLAGNMLLEAIRTRDYARFQSCLADEKMTEREFADACENLRKQFGGIESFRLIALPETPLAGQGVWLVRFERNNRKGKAVRQELLFRIAGGMSNGKYKVIAIGFL